jgi:DNA-binding transcriptional MocR family regulator
VPLFEDDAYGKLEPNAVPLASLVPERTYFAASLSKCIAPGLRVSLLLTPDQASAEVLVSALRASVQMPAFLMVALVTRWLQDGSADVIIGAILNEASARQKLAADVLVQHAYSRHPNGHHILVPFAAQLGQDGVRVACSKVRVGYRYRRIIQRRESPPNAIRVSLGAASSRAELVRALEVLATALRSSAARARVVSLGGHEISTVFENQV